MILPATAVEDGHTFNSAGVLAGGNVFPLTMILAIPAIRLELIWYSLGGLIPETVDGLYYSAIGLVLCLFIVFEVIAMSVAYQTLSKSDQRRADSPKI